ncbi:MAG: hypothetical protein KJ077_11060 [Anaerolineae bacterium]|nr:hypothetical protein [Anaerolineae bacterium]
MTTQRLSLEDKIVGLLNQVGVQPNMLEPYQHAGRRAFKFRKLTSRATLSETQYAWRITDAMPEAKILDNYTAWYEGEEYITVAFVPVLPEKDHKIGVYRPMTCGEFTGRRTAEGKLCSCELRGGKDGTPGTTGLCMFGECLVHDINANKLPPYQLGQTIWALVTSDGIPTQGRVETVNKNSVMMRSVRTGSAYEVPVKQIQTRPPVALEQIVYAVVTPDGVATKGKVAEITPTGIRLQSLRTGRTYDVPDPAVHYTKFNAEAYFKQQVTA